MKRPISVMIVYDSAWRDVCGLCHQPVFPHEPRVVEANSPVNSYQDLQIAHLECYKQIQGPSPFYGWEHNQ